VRFVDTSFWWGARSRADRRHAQAAALVAAGIGPVLTSDLVVGEVWTLTRRGLGHAAAVQSVDAIFGLPDLTVEAVTPEDAEAAWAWLRLHDEREYSYVDATSFALMRRLGILEAYAFDGDFAAAGFIEVRP